MAGSVRRGRIEHRGRRPSAPPRRCTLSRPDFGASLFPERATSRCHGNERHGSYERLVGRLEGLTDAEYFWEPVDGCWSLREGADGRWRLDGGEGGAAAPDP